MAVFGTSYQAQQNKRHSVRSDNSRTMTDHPNRQNELKKMTLCEPCTGIQRNWRRAPGHVELLQRGNRQVLSKGKLVTMTSYICDRCGTALAAPACPKCHAELAKDARFCNACGAAAS